MDDDTTIEAIQERYAEILPVFRSTVPTERTGYFQAVIDIGWLLDYLEGLEERAHQDDLAGIAQRNELALLRADNLQRRSEDVYYGRNRRDYDPRREP